MFSRKRRREGNYFWQNRSKTFLRKWKLTQFLWKIFEVRFCTIATSSILNLLIFFFMMLKWLFWSNLARKKDVYWPLCIYNRLQLQCQPLETLSWCQPYWGNAKDEEEEGKWCQLLLSWWHQWLKRWLRRWLQRWLQGWLQSWLWRR